MRKLLDLPDVPKSLYPPFEPPRGDGLGQSTYAQLSFMRRSSRRASKSEGWKGRNNCLTVEMSDAEGEVAGRLVVG